MSDHSYMGTTSTPPTTGYSPDPQDPESPTHNNYGSKTPSGNPRIYNCKQCNRAFTREEHLTRHTLSTHNKLKPFMCGICQRPFSRRDLLLRHAKNLHQGSEMAVSRIRKSYRRNEASGSGSPHLDEDEGEINDDGSADYTKHTSSSASRNSRRSIDNSDIMNREPGLGVGLGIEGSGKPPHVRTVSRATPSANSSATAPTSSAGSPALVSSGGVNSILQDEPFNPTQTITSSSKTGYDTPEKKRMKISVNMLVS